MVESRREDRHADINSLVRKSQMKHSDTSGCFLVYVEEVNHAVQLDWEDRES